MAVISMVVALYFLKKLPGFLFMQQRSLISDSIIRVSANGSVIKGADTNPPCLSGFLFKMGNLTSQSRQSY